MVGAESVNDTEPLKDRDSFRGGPTDRNEVLFILLFISDNPSTIDLLVSDPWPLRLPSCSILEADGDSAVLNPADCSSSDIGSSSLLYKLGGISIPPMLIIHRFKEGDGLFQNERMRRWKMEEEKNDGEEHRAARDRVEEAVRSEFSRVRESAESSPVLLAGRVVVPAKLKAGSGGFY